MKAPKSLKITGLTLQANGTGSLNGIDYEVPFTLPEEIAEIQVISQKDNKALALPGRVIKPSPFRIKPDCKHFGTCGACHYRHVRYNKSIQIKEALFYTALQKIQAGIRKREAAELDLVMASISMEPAPDPKKYRNNVRFYTHEKKLMQHTMLTHENFEVRECFVVSDKTWESATTWKWKLPSSISEIEIRENEKGEQMCIVSGTNRDQVPLLPAESLYFYDTAKKTYTHVAGSKTLTHHLEISGRHFDFDIGPDSFFQVHTAMAEILYRHISKVVPQTGTLHDLFAGTGTIGIVLAKLYPKLKVTSVEINAEMVEMAKANAIKNEVKNITCKQDDVRTLKLKKAPDCILVDPPRNGLQADSLEHLLSLGSPSIVYVSCSPTTFLRDMQLMLTHYTLKHVKLFDMTPYTSHMELVGVFEKR